MKILIVGAGIGGLTLANFCKKYGIEFDLIEQEKNLSHHGFSIGLWSNGRDVLEKINLEDKFDALRKEYKNFNITTHNGDSIYSYDLSEFKKRYGSTYSHIKRRDLIDILGANVIQNIHFDTVCKNIKNTSSCVEVEFSHGETKRYDLLIACDGVHSRTRDLFFDTQKKSSNMEAWYYLSENLPIESESVTQEIGSGILDSNFDEGEYQDLIVFILNKNIIKKDMSLKMVFSRFENLNKIKIDETKVFKTSLFRIKNKQWFKKRIVLLGDSAHAFEPFGGLGGSMAMEDALVLSRLLKKDTDMSFGAKLSLYEENRKKRVGVARKITSRMQFWTTLRFPFNYIFIFFLRIMPKSFFIKPYQKLFDEKQ